MSIETGEGLYTAAEYITSAWDFVIMPLVLPERKSLARSILGQTIRAYSEPHRRYHGLMHIEYCLRLLKPYDERSDYVELFMALLGHNVMYDTSPEYAPMNESYSAQLTSEHMDDIGLTGAPTTSRLIISTASHKADAEDEALVCAIDMAILGESEDRYGAYKQGIRQEYGWVPESTYRLGRSAVLNGLMADGQPFVHPDFLHLNTPAIANMEAECRELSAT
jgi:predicted metal-dependent HD superfamily phosphohydrolase